MLMRGAVLAAGWLLAVGAATTVSWAGVRLVGDEVAPAVSGALSQAEVEQRIQDASEQEPDPESTSGPEAASPSTVGPAPAPGESPSAVPSVTRRADPTRSSADPTTAAQTSVVARGGSAVVRCTGPVASVRYVPAPGFSGSQERWDDGAVEVEFSDGVLRSRIEATCRSGVPMVEVEESVRVRHH